MKHPITNIRPLTSPEYENALRVRINQLEGRVERVKAALDAMVPQIAAAVERALTADEPLTADELNQTMGLTQ